jgi:hypothetical protein
MGEVITGQEFCVVLLHGLYFVAKPDRDVIDRDRAAAGEKRRKGVPHGVGRYTSIRSLGGRDRVCGSCAGL